VSPRFQFVRQYDDEVQNEKVTMSGADWLAERFEGHRNHLRSVAYRMLGSLHDADDAVQEAWLRLSRSDVSEVENLRGWLTTVVARVCLDTLRSRKLQREESLELTVPQIRADLSAWIDPEEETIMADSVGLALLVVLERLTAAERIAFVLHDVFGVSFDEISPIVGRTTIAAKKLASRARQKVQADDGAGNRDLRRQRRVAEAFLAASRARDVKALIALLDPQVTRRADRQALPPGVDAEVHGAERVASETAGNSALAQHARIVLVDGSVGMIVVLRRRVRVALRLEIEGERIREVEVIANPERIQGMRLSVLDETSEIAVQAERKQE
jgi:RNA polymerase sigma-70 factor (ECF subfamily)